MVVQTETSLEGEMLVLEVVLTMVTVAAPCQHLQSQCSSSSSSSSSSMSGCRSRSLKSLVWPCGKLAGMGP